MAGCVLRNLLLEKEPYPALRRGANGIETSSGDWWAKQGPLAIVRNAVPALNVGRVSRQRAGSGSCTRANVLVHEVTLIKTASEDRLHSLKHRF